MIRCPNCGSTAQVKVEYTHYDENGDVITVTRDCGCGCGARFINREWYYSDGLSEICEE